MSIPFQQSADMFMLALTMWREDRGGGVEGMRAVGCSIRNRVNDRKQSYYTVTTARLQYSCNTFRGDPNTVLWPDVTNTAFIAAQILAAAIIDGSQADTTGGATNYYALSMKEPPAWASEMTYTVTVGGQKYFK